MRKRIAPPLACLLALSACGSGDRSPSTGAILFRNGSTAEVASLQVAPPSAADWGPVVNGSPIPAGGTFPVPDLAPGSYDALAVVQGPVGTYQGYVLGVAVARGQTVAAEVTDASFTGVLSVRNGSATVALDAVQLAPPGGAYGANVLAAPLAPGASIPLGNLDPGLWGVRCTHAGGSVTTTSASVASLTSTAVSCG